MSVGGVYTYIMASVYVGENSLCMLCLFHCPCVGMHGVAGVNSLCVYICCVSVILSLSVCV